MSDAIQPATFPYQTICITGGTGTFGTAFATYLHVHYPSVHIRILSRDEVKQAVLRAALGDANVSYLLGDVRDVERLRLAFRGVDLVVHAAALKQVPASEYNPSMFIEVNVLGSENVMRAALDCGVNHSILLSSDKACQPINLYGSTKMLAERLFIQANSYSYDGGPRFNVTRYGNIAGSRGSALELFRDKLARGEPLPLTHPDMTRFWMAPAEAVSLVLFAAMHAGRGEIFVPELPAFDVVDLLRALLGERDDYMSAIEVVGVRPGEKLHEALLTAEEIGRMRGVWMDTHMSMPFKVYAVQPHYHSWSNHVAAARYDLSAMKTHLAGREDYDSRTWPKRLDVRDIMARLKDLR